MGAETGSQCDGETMDGWVDGQTDERLSQSGEGDIRLDLLVFRIGPFFLSFLLSITTPK